MGETTRLTASDVSLDRPTAFALVFEACMATSGSRNCSQPTGEPWLVMVANLTVFIWLLHRLFEMLSSSRPCWYRCSILGTIWCGSTDGMNLQTSFLTLRLALVCSTFAVSHPKKSRPPKYRGAVPSF